MKENSTIFKKYCLSLFIISFLFFLPFSSILAATELSGQEIIKRSDDLMRGDTVEGSYIMTVTTPNWQRTLELHAYSKGRNKTFIKINKPLKEAGITTLRIDNNMWNYLPKVERTIKIPPSMMLQPWMGSDFANDDLVKESSIVYDYTHKIIEQTDTKEGPAFVIELTPKPNAAVIWGKLIFWVRVSDFVPLKEEFYDEHGKLIKVLEYSQIKKMSDRFIPTIWSMEPKTKAGSKTVIEVVEANYNKPISEDIFSFSNLKK